ncbi:hypothetical protein TIFTF001_022191 [Ficus carica]|uniref:Nuclear transcription factor Y subunit n=1 Tax=Ficus carica TaxID=3494 RepID=A0AA88DBH7_FICCA|nr:hypothetical protein TIFTF001_022191 [Ficus carica]
MSVTRGLRACWTLTNHETATNQKKRKKIPKIRSLKAKRFDSARGQRGVNNSEGRLTEKKRDRMEPKRKLQSECEAPTRSSTLYKAFRVSTLKSLIDLVNLKKTCEDAISSEGAVDQMKPLFLFNNPDFSLNHSQFGCSHPMAGVPYPYADPYFGGLLTSYGPQALMVGIAPARVPLPLEIADDGPIYVNAKQYHGIIRRRQSRAKQEAQNKLIKNRKVWILGASPMQF